VPQRNQGLSSGCEGIAKLLSSPPSSKAAASIRGLYDMFIATDSTMVEVNPFSELPDGRVVAVDAKVNFDDNAQFRQSEIFAQRDYSQVRG
jgi:succinyl-CoA synthetase beta subunit